MSENQQVKVGYQPPAAYMDMARSMLGEIRHFDGADRSSLEFLETHENCLFAVMSVSIVFSYQAVEAECNALLHLICSQTGESTLHYRRLMEKCGETPSFKKIKRKSLGEKIKILCNSLNIRTPSEADSTNWNRFKQITEAMRHFIIHPDPERFEAECSKMMEEIRAGTYVAVAQNIIRHFYVEAGTKVPAWVETPMFFKCRGFELLKPNQDGQKGSALDVWY